MANIHNFEVKTIDGTPKSLADYKGKALLIVNVASRCGLTPQYAGLEALHKELGPQGFAVLGFPANEFGAQEPGTDDEIKAFCSTTYDVSFDMFSKVKVKGEGIHPLFAALTGDAKHGGEIKWNFNKFLIDKEGNVVGRFEPQVEPSNPDFRTAIQKTLV